MRAFLSNESGASLVEYGLLVGLIAVAAMAAVSAVGTKIATLFNAVANELNDVANSIG